MTEKWILGYVMRLVGEQSIKSEENNKLTYAEKICHRAYQKDIYCLQIYCLFRRLTNLMSKDVSISISRFINLPRSQSTTERTKTAEKV